MGKINTLSLFIFAFVMAGCAAGYCRTAKAPEENVLIYKADGGLQCGQGKAVEVEVMMKELESLTVISSRKDNDGMLRPTVCGAATGQINVYEIPYKQLSKALQRGFKELDR